MQEGYDNSGLLVGHPETEIGAALLCVDVTDDVMDEAVKLGAGLVISHHPIIFNPIRRLTGRDHVERLVERAVRENIAVYACHTNLDSVPGGLSYKLAGTLDVKDVRLLGAPSPVDPNAGFGVIGRLESPVEPMEYLRSVKR